MATLEILNLVVGCNVFHKEHGERVKRDTVLLTVDLLLASAVDELDQIPVDEESTIVLLIDELDDVVIEPAKVQNSIRSCIVHAVFGYDSSVVLTLSSSQYLLASRY